MKIRLYVSLVIAVFAAVLLSPAQVRTQDLRAGGRQREHFQGQEVAAGEVLVRFKSAGASPADVRRDADAADDRPVGGQGWRRIRSGSRSVQALVAMLAARGDVAEVSPNYIVHTTQLPNDPSYPQLWNMDAIHAPSAWDISTGTPNIVVGIIDTGIELTHPDLIPNLWTAPSAFTVTIGGQSITCPAGSHGFNAINRTCNPMDDAGHGTHVAGTVGAAGNNGIGVTGVNWTTRLMGLKFLDSTGTGSVADAIDAIEFAIQAKAIFGSQANVRVLNNSWGGSGTVPSLSTEIQKAATNGMLFVAAAGNGYGANNDGANPFYPASLNLPSIISVASTDPGDTLSAFSNIGPISVDLAAPGGGIGSTYLGGTYAGAGGTSMATPHVSGAAALVLSRCNLTTTQVRDTILNTVDVLASLNGLVATNGRLNVDRAIRSCAVLPTVSVTSPSSGAVFTSPATIALSANASSSVGIARVDFYNGTTLIGTSPSSSSPYTLTWQSVSPGTYTVTAKAYDALGAGVFSPGVVITVSSSGEVNVAAAARGATASASSTYNTAYPPSAAIDGNRRGDPWGAGGGWNDATADAYPDWIQVDFNGTHTINEIDVFTLQDNPGAPSDPTPALTFSKYGIVDFDVQYWTGSAWQTVPGGHITGNNNVWRSVAFSSVTTNRIRVTITNALFYNSRVVEIEAYEVPAAVNQPPTVGLTSLNGTSFSAPASVSLRAAASDSDGINRVEFFQTPSGGQKVQIGQAVTTSPYDMSWTNVPAGTYSVVATAYDNLGASTTSAPLTITVTAPVSINVAAAANGGVATASSSYSPSYPPTAVNDGDRTGANWGVGGGWNDATFGAYPDWVQIDFAASSTINEIDVFTLQDSYWAPSAPTLAMAFSNYGVRDFDVQYWDGSAWQTVPGGRVTGNTNVWRQFTFASVTTSKIRVLVSQALASYSRLVEIEAYQASGAPPANTPPTVSLASLNGSSFTAPASVSLRATASDGDGINRVEFYATPSGGQTVQIGQAVTTSPYDLAWTNVAAGSYSVFAKAYDALGASSVSSPLTITVTGAAAMNIAAASNGGVATASSSYSSGYPVLAVNDGDRKGLNWGAGGGWNDATADAYPDWVQVDFTGTHSISEIDVFTLQDAYWAPSAPTQAMTFGNYGIQDFDVQYWDGATWQTVSGGHVTGNTNVWRKFTFTAVSTTKIRVVVSRALASYSRIVEIEAYEP